MLQSRREFLTGAVLSTAFPGNLVALSADAALLATLSPYELELVLQSMVNCPVLSCAKAIDMLRAAGM
jgi:hypothetical protein